MKGEVEDNPFKLPPDDQIFLIREQERQRRAEEREKVKHQHVHEKTTSSNRINRSRRVEDGADDAQLAAEAAKKGRGGASGGARPEGGSVGRDARREKENVAEFVAKKREMFLVQMSLDVKKAEIVKLDERAKEKEKALKKSQQMLDEDVTRFDAFLQNNDQRAHKAMKTAEEMTKKKQDRMQRIKQLKSQLSAIQSEIAKHREQKDECLKTKEFLEKLTPSEWKEEKADEKSHRKKQRKNAWVERRMAENNSLMLAEQEAEERALEVAPTTGRRRQRREAEEEAKEREKELETRKRRIRRKYPTQEAIEGDYPDVSSGEEMPLFFQEPKQLLDIFTSLEESNLFLIQNSQDTEQALEELQQKFADMKKTRSAMTNKMKQQISLYERQIADERAKCDELLNTISQKHGASEQEELLKELADRVAEVYAVCSNEAETDGDNTLQMLGGVEAKLEEFLTFLDQAEEDGLGDKVEVMERTKERDRRLQLRLQRKEQQDRKIEKRLKESLQRSQAPVHKKVGKQIMFRSAPLFQAHRVVQEDDGFEEAVREHDVFGIWLGKDGIPNAAAPSKQPGS
ncbi:unnamed protein product [Polarella glacialis]|uniref:DUF4200 domain-containing protein n=1 Tax=Polarella glacialis TaxID=89957 RepID=A0A813IPI4_POLGL|nr:unnamed protein product [Polarella glacialis]CAE8652685.1 unnamed protein product [Polarella glacialis]|eukprot:CAMPEP_0115084098 /NCGR_PEP_ID=MMETSP0227-20121206/21019_1 /TAXON_ID=89957 /ORGANISM="Polarella glacialis, Strain CCMP 1383" /LENGTH=571 /DNA_ID=CAMNT_0002472763 /DNA_START=102 /DNA_END=1817 /DNA_ORIENTATION=+